MDDARDELYARLGLSPTASDAQIRKAYLTLARQLHPDRGGGAEAAARLSRIGEAWAVLRNPVTKAAYDADGDEGLEALDNEGGIAAFDDDDDDLDSDDSDDDAFDAAPSASVAAFFGGGSAAAADSHQSHSARWAQGLAGRSDRQTSAEPTSAAPDRETTLLIADAVAAAIRRTEERAAARYERTLVLLVQQLSPMDRSQAEAKVKRAWDEAGRE